MINHIDMPAVQAVSVGLPASLLKPAHPRRAVSAMEAHVARQALSVLSRAVHAYRADVAADGHGELLRSSQADARARAITH